MEVLRRYLWCLAYLLMAAGFVLLGREFNHFNIPLLDLAAYFVAIMCGLEAIDRIT